MSPTTSPPLTFLMAVVASSSLAVAAWSPAARADAVKLEVIAISQKGTSLPGLAVLPQIAAEDLIVDVRCGGATANRAGYAEAGERILLELDAPIGTHACTGQLAGVFSDGSEGSMPLSFQITVLDAMRLRFDADRTDVDQRMVGLTADRDLDRVEVRAFGLDGQQIGEGTAAGAGAGVPIDAQWSGEGEVLRIEVKALDVHGFWASGELFPWYYEVPHDDVVFASNQSAVTGGEAHKLTAAMGEIDTIVQRYGAVAEVNLYVAGYTDSVGSTEHNRHLSERRAAAIASWFRAAGFTGEIWYQGFGERGKAVPTPDEVDEVRNRRAAYIVAAEPPPVTSQMPAAVWLKL